MIIKIRSKLINIYSRNGKTINLTVYKKLLDLCKYKKISYVEHDKINEDELYDTIRYILSLNKNIRKDINDYILEYDLNLKSMMCKNIKIKRNDK